MTPTQTIVSFLAAWLVTLAGPASAGEDFVPLAARYQESRGDGHTPARPFEWFLTREANSVEIARPGYIELWARDARGVLSWQRIFHDDQKVIEYAPGDLRAMNRDLPWETLNTVVDFRKLRASLQEVGKISFLDRPAIRYAGKIGNEEVDLIWLEAEQVPGRLLRRGLHTDYSLRLEELRTEQADDWPKSDLARAQSYEYIDGADLGDREYDPFVKKVQAMDGHSHGHAH
jgi:hypothetical protein